MIIGIVTFGANRQKKLLRRFSDAALPEVGAAQRVGRFPIVRLKPLRCPPMFDGCFRLTIFREKCGKGVLRRDRLRMVPDELVVDLLNTQTLFYRYVGIRERLRCLIGRFDFYPRFCRRTDGFGIPEHRRKEQNDERGGSALALTRIAPPAVADYHTCRSPEEITFTRRKIAFTEALNCRHRQPSFTGGLRRSRRRASLYHKKAKENQGRGGPHGKRRLGSFQPFVANDRPSHS